MAIEIRPATIFDIHEVYEIELQCFEEDLRFEKDLFYLFLMGQRGEIFLVAEEGTSQGERMLVGFIIGYLNNQNNYEIITINVAPERQNQGIGKQLMLEFERILKLKVKNIRQQKKITIELVVYEQNYAAKHLYEKLGYKEVARIANYYPKNRTGIKMKKEIMLETRDSSSKNL